ncbi:MFS transporter [Clostridium sp. AWRP]|uniref:MFS transporter n=1 Tax=Clostridium sp. AWRP TaxID=2212991 RepID=UPI001FAA129F|nr:MFS transporter [Clostridium sp. AWRP]
MSKGMSKGKSAIIFAIFSFSFLVMAQGATSPALASIGQAFPKIDFSVVVLIATLPCLTTIPFSMIGGKLAGNIMTFRSVTIIGIILTIIGGAFPYFTNSFVVILIMRAILGAGVGLISPIPSALIMNFFQGKDVENLMGYNSVIQNIGGIVFQMLGGFLCVISWRTTFLTYLLAVISLIVVIFMLPEPQKVEKAKNEKVKMPGMVYVWSIIFLVYTLINYPMLTGISSLIVDNKLGTSASAAMALTMFSIGGMFTGAIFGKLYHIAVKYTIVVGTVLHAIGFVILIYGNSVFMFTVATTIVGMGFGLVVPAVIMYVGMPVPQSAQPFAISIALAFMSIGGFVSSFFFAFVEKTFNISSMRFPFVFGAVCLVIYSIVQSVVNLKTSKPESIGVK